MIIRTIPLSLLKRILSNAPDGSNIIVFLDSWKLREIVAIVVRVDPRHVLSQRVNNVPPCQAWVIEPGAVILPIACPCSFIT
jgi:hypothetical protein